VARIDSGRRVLSVRLLGPLSVEDGSRVLGPRDFGGIKPKQLLEMLLCEGGRPVSKDRLADGLWGDRLPRNVEATLETYVSVLRRALGELGRDIVVTEQRAYRCALDRVSRDVDDFDALLERADRGDTPTAYASLERALELAGRGELLADEPYAEWAATLRRHYNGKILAAFVAAANAALSLADADASLAHADAALARDRFHEPAHRARILALYALGRQHDALEAYAVCRRLLADELGLEPMPETRDLQRAILAQVDPAQLIVPPILPPPAAPAPLLVGRRRELDELERAARAGLSGHGAVIVVEGEPSIGKTTLLDALAARLAGTRVGRAECTSAERALSYVPLAAALRDALGDHESPLGIDEEASRLDVFEALAAIAREHAPLVLLLDDLHCADEDTIAALAYMRRRCVQIPLVILAAADADKRETVDRLRPSLRIRLEALAAVELEDAALHEQTGGHPQLLRAVLDDDPAPAEALSKTLLARCRERGPFSYRVLLTASVLGSPFDPDALAEALDVDALYLVEELEELCERRLLIAVGDRFHFRYPVLREALHRSLTPARRRLLHERLSPTVPVRLAG
jgi:DNA-binding SARP family transcriptional activator